MRQIYPMKMERTLSHAPAFHPVKCLLMLLGCFTGMSMVSSAGAQDRHTVVSIEGEAFHINGRPTYDGRTWTTSDGNEHPIEGLLMNARLVQGVFDDLNLETRGQWAYPDTRSWDPDRNTNEFVRALAGWREHGLIAFTVNLQGGCPYGYCRSQPWENSAFAPDGSLRGAYMERLARILDRADELGMVAILGYFYFGQDERLEDEAAVVRAVENATEWVLDHGYRNVVVEINNECNIAYDHAILRCERVDELIERAQSIGRDGHSLLVSTSLGGGSVPPAHVVAASDFVLLHGNGVRDPERIVEMIREVRSMDAYSPMPIVVNEDDQPWRVEEQGWGEHGNNFVAAVKQGASWGYFDFRRQDEATEYNLGHQSVPVNWQITSDRQRDFSELLARITGSPGTPSIGLEWGPDFGVVQVRVDNAGGTQVDRVDLVINDAVVASTTGGSGRLEIGAMPWTEHWVRVRATYHRGDRAVVIESSAYKNPWWPYGGRGD